MNDDQLTALVRRCNCTIPKNGMSARFTDSKNLSFKWLVLSNVIHIVIPDYLRDAPERILLDITKKIIQQALYDSDQRLTEDSKKWMLTGLHTPEKVRVFCERNNLTQITEYNDAVIVTSDGDYVDSSVFFRVVAIPKSVAASPERDSVIASAYKQMLKYGKQFMEA